MSKPGSLLFPKTSRGVDYRVVILHPSPEAVGPAPAEDGAAMLALLRLPEHTGLGKFSRSRGWRMVCASLRPYALFPCGDNRRGCVSPGYHAVMTDDLSRSVATSPSSEYTLTIEDAALLYERAGHPRTDRTIQRYCAKGHLDCRRVETQFGEKFLIVPASVSKHIAYIEEVRPVPTGRDVPRQVATTVAAEESRDDQRQGPATGTDMSPPVADAFLTQLKGENEFLRGQITVKDKTIEALLERDRETNILVGQLQQMLTPLLSRPDDSSGGKQPDRG